MGLPLMTATDESTTDNSTTDDSTTDDSTPDDCHLLFQRGDHPPVPQLVDQLGHQDVLRADGHAGQVSYHDAERGARTDRIHLL